MSEAQIDRDAEAFAATYVAAEQVRQMLREAHDDIAKQFSALDQTIAAALSAYHRGDKPEVKRLCREMLDREHELLGDTRSELLTSALGYTDEDDEDEILANR